MICRSSRVLKLIAVLVVSSLCSVAHATVTRTMGGWSGLPLDGDPLSCYKESFGGMFYVGGPSCTGHRWEVPLAIDATGTSRTVSFVSQELNFQGTGCGVIAVDPISLSSAIATTLGGGPSEEVHQVTLNNIPASETILYFFCFGLQSTPNLQSRLQSVSWNAVP